MSALAARRAAQTAKGATSSPAPSKATSSRPAARARTPSVSSASESAASDEFEDEPVAGPSKRVRLSASATKPRYYAAPLEEAVEPVAAPARKPKRKRAYSPGAPVDSDAGDDSSADEELAVEVPDVDDGNLESTGITPYGTPGPSRRSGPEALATSNFAPRRSVNVEMISAAGLRKAGLNDVAGSGLVISISSTENLSLAGSFHLVPLQRSISLLSSTLSPSTDLQPRHPVFAPISHPVPNISHGASQSAQSSPLLARLPLPSSFDKSPARAVFLILENQSGIEGMRGGAIPGFNTVWGDDKGWMGLKGVHAVPGSILSSCYPYTTSPSWSTALKGLIPRPPANGHANGSAPADDDEDSPIVLVKGSKRSGKSALARAALNTLLGEFDKVAWLECDLGQGEFGCGGVLGLWILDQPVFGPPFTHPRQADRAHFLGAYTPLTCPDEYLAAIEHLLQYYRYEIQYPSTSSSNSTRRKDTVPLVINTQGWVKGLGEELLRALEGFAQATHVFAFDTAVDESSDRPGWTSSPTLPPVPLPPTSTGRPPRVYIVDPVPPSALQARYTAIDHRMLSTLSYFHSILPAPHTPAETTWDFSTPLVASPPYEVVLGEAIKAIYLTGEGADGVLPQDLPLALNGSIVALLEIENLDPEAELYTQNRPLPSLDDTNFLGFGIIRAISPKSSMKGTKLHLLTPLSTASLARVNVIAKNGAMELPTPGMLDWRDRGEEAGGGVLGVPWGEVPFFDTGSGGVGVERRRWRRNLMRKGM